MWELEMAVCGVVDALHTYPNYKKPEMRPMITPRISIGFSTGTENIDWNRCYMIAEFNICNYPFDENNVFGINTNIVDK